MPQPKRSKSVVELLGIMDVPTAGRDRLLVTAIDLFYNHGFNAVGLDRILAEAGVTKTTFYKHFESRDQLVLEAIALRHSWETDAWMQQVESIAGGEPLKELVAMFDVLDNWFNRTEYGGCMFVSAALEFPNPDDPVHKAAAEHKQLFVDWITQLATEEGLDLSAGFIDQYLMLFEGALIYRQVYGRDDAARNARPMIEALIARSQPASAATV